MSIFLPVLECPLFFMCRSMSLSMLYVVFYASHITGKYFPSPFRRRR